ncbi:hypothetical protein Dimus_031930, partial [Dionaea muscipula]
QCCGGPTVYRPSPVAEHPGPTKVSRGCSPGLFPGLLTAVRGVAIDDGVALVESRVCRPASHDSSLQDSTFSLKCGVHRLGSLLASVIISFCVFDSIIGISDSLAMDEEINITGLNNGQSSSCDDVMLDNESDASRDDKEVNNRGGGRTNFYPSGKEARSCRKLLEGKEESWQRYSYRPPKPLCKGT